MAAAFTDIQGHWAQACIEELAQQQILRGYPDGTFRPDAPLTRTEFAVLVSRAFPNAKGERMAIDFVDVPGSYWAAAGIRKAYETGFLSGYPGQMFKPKDKILRVEVLVALATGLKFSPVNAVNVTLNRTFADAPEIPQYAHRAIAAATETSLVVNYPEVRRLKPNQWATRAEVAAILCQAITGSDRTSPVPSEYVPRLPRKEIRGVWITNIDSEVMFEPFKLQFAMERLDGLNFNTVYPNVWSRGYTLYPSQVAEPVVGLPHHPAPWLQGRDMLAEMVEQGHAKGLSVIPWFEYGFMAPPDSEMARRYPQWLTCRRDRTQVVQESGVDRLWLNPWHPEVQEFIEGLVLEIVGNYDVDGIQFDDHFSVPVELGYDDYTVELYKQEHMGLLPPDDPNDVNWRRWRSQKLTQFIQRVFKAVKQRKPNAIISLSPNYQDFAYKFYLQDWRGWQRFGFVEELVLQVYRDNIDSFIAELQRPEVELAQRNIPVAVGILTGLRTRGVPISQVEKQVNIARNMGFSGVSFFFYESLFNFSTETPGDRVVVLQNLFPDPVPRASLTETWEPIVKWERVSV
ncbi:glycoside hydrolase family 10 protein [Phormidium sp. CCY1219]|uniref:glycoside hydrolase family 10 protein n=1 Tax=Phormidium sp. CCY1219 TaxID=2886104 RepID=UPI002D1E9CF2|nr:family 10 glycosylhydrolase [Phormidium sp. CCY1219]MEB3826760.1 family 10 glycosylhydrolase [Phormidium sp. CCY1219]